jgi:fluoride exporter
VVRLTPLVVIGIGLAGGIGAVARFALDGLVGGRMASEFPFGTLAVNLLGAFVLGVLVGATVSGNTYRLAGTGLIGGFTTFSTWVFESHRLGEDGELSLGLLNLAVSLVLGLAAAWAGKQIGAAL